MRKVLCLFLLISSGASAQKKIENLEDFVHLEFSFEKGKFELTQEHLNQLGSSIFDLYNSPVVLVKAHYPATGNTSHNEGLALKRLEQIKRFLDEEAIPNDIVIMEAVGDSKPVDLVMSYMVENGLTSKKKDIDTVIIHRDGYRIRCKSKEIDAYAALNIRPVKLHEEEALVNISDKGENLAALRIVEVKAAEGFLEHPDTAILYLPADEGIKGSSLSAYRLNKYTREWVKIQAGAQQVTLAKRKFYAIPFTESGYLSLQYNVEKQSIPVIMKAPQGMGFLDGTLKTGFPDMVQPGEVSSDQKEIRFMLSAGAEQIKLQAQLLHATGDTYRINGEMLLEELRKKMRNSRPGETLTVEMKKEYLIGEEQAENK